MDKNTHVFKTKAPIHSLKNAKSTNKITQQYIIKTKVINYKQEEIYNKFSSYSPVVVSVHFDIAQTLLKQNLFVLGQGYFNSLISLVYACSTFLYLNLVHDTK